MLLSDCVGQRVLAADGARVGRVSDLAAEPGEASATVTAVAVDRGRRMRLLPWSCVAVFEPDAVQLRAGPVEPRPLGERELLLARDVQDAQIVDLAGRRVVRVGDVRLQERDGLLSAVAVEVGAPAILRRLGLRRLARRLPPEAVPLGELHVVGGRAHELRLRSGRLDRLGPAALAAVVSRAPLHSGLELLGAVPPDLAAESVAASHPRLGGRVLTGLDTERAAAVIERMPSDDAAAALRHVDPERLDELLGAVGSARARGLRRLLAQPAGTAGGLMTLDVVTSSHGEPVESLRARVAADGRWARAGAGVVVVDGDRRPLGVLAAADLLAGRSEPVPVPVLRLDTPVERVIDLFAVQDVLTLPVVDADGRLAGAVGIEDVLEELWAERLPGRRRLRGFTRPGTRAPA
jgi:CBS domain-containing protein